MSVVKSMFSAFLMYSRIPMPQVEWCEKNRRYSLCFFPMIGAVIGACLLLWRYICNVLSAGDVFFSVGAVLIPLLITGGIHMDGFCDVSDAIASCGSRQKKLEIMSDSHIGAFAVIKLAMYLLVMFGLFTELNDYNNISVVAIGYVVSRTLSAIAAICFKSAKKEGTLQSFVKPAHRNVSIIALAIIFILSVGLAVYFNVISGTAAIITALCVFAYYRIFSYKQFGGVTGDLAGYFLQLCELFILAAVVISAKTVGVICL